MRRWAWGALGIVGLASACDKPEAPAGPVDPAATATATPTADAGQEAAATEAGTGAPPLADPALSSEKDGGPSRAEAPLLYWMRERPAPALRQGDLFALAAAFDQLATFAPKAPPPAYANWASIARDGADAARAASLEGVKGACRGCHGQYRGAYRAEMRARPLP